MTAPVETRADLWGLWPDQPDCASREFPLSTFAPPPVNAPALDYDAVMAEIDRLEAVLQELKMQAARAA